MLRIVSGCFLAVFILGANPANAQKPRGQACTYEACVESCQKTGGGGRQGGCSTYCDRTIRERKASGVCK